MPKTAKFRKTARRVAVYFKEWREHAKLTQQALADRLGTTKSRVSVKERGIEGWDDVYLAAMTDALGLDHPALFLIHNPLERTTHATASWVLLHGLKPESRAKVIDYIETLRKAEQTEDRDTEGASRVNARAHSPPPNGGVAARVAPKTTTEW